MVDDDVSHAVNERLTRLEGIAGIDKEGNSLEEEPTVEESDEVEDEDEDDESAE